MHFKCIKCPNEFCSGCGQSIKRGQVSLYSHGSISLFACVYHLHSLYIIIRSVASWSPARQEVSTLTTLETASSI